MLYAHTHKKKRFDRKKIILNVIFIYWKCSKNVQSDKYLHVFYLHFMLISWVMWNNDKHADYSVAKEIP